MVFQDADSPSTLNNGDYSILPSTFLPPIRKICDFSSRYLANLVALLAHIYTPNVFGTGSGAEDGLGFNYAGNGPPASHSGSGPQKEQENEGIQSLRQEDIHSSSHLSSVSIPVLNSAQLATLRADEFERAYAIQWLTGLIARSDECTESQDNIDDPSNTQDERVSRERIIEKACALLAACSGSSAQGAITRTFKFLPKFQSHTLSISNTSIQLDNETQLDDGLSSTANSDPPNTIQTMYETPEIQVQLKDDPVPAQDQDAVGLQTWGCAPILAELISEDVRRFGLDLRELVAKSARNSIISDNENKSDKKKCSRDGGAEKEAVNRDEIKVDYGGVKEVSNDLFTGEGESLGTVDAKPRLRILELGAGTGLLSIFLWRLLEYQSDYLITSNAHNPVTNHSSNQEDGRTSGDITDINCEIVATDYHPSVLENMTYNIQLNTSSSSPPVESGPRHPSTPPGTRLRTECLDWKRPPSLEEENKYDLIFGADIVYEKGHAELIKGVVERTLKRPNGFMDPGGIFWLMYPLRHTHTVESESIERAFGLVGGSTPSLGVVEEQSLTRKKGIGRGDDEVEYRVLKIGWM